MCLIFLSVLSALSLAVLEAAWSGQRMVSAYVLHQQQLISLEKTLILAERSVGQQLVSAGVEQTFKNWSHAQASHVQGFESLVVGAYYGDWMLGEFTEMRCGPLFLLQISEGPDQPGRLNPEVQWHVCCLSSITCEAAEFVSQSRLWSRSAKESAPALVGSQ